MVDHGDVQFSLKLSSDCIIQGSCQVHLDIVVIGILTAHPSDSGDDLTCLLSATEAPCVPVPLPPEWPTHPVTTRGRRVGGGGEGMTGDNGRERESEAWWEEQGGRMVEAWWVGAPKIPLMCPLHSPACDLRAPDSQKVLKHASVPLPGQPGDLLLEVVHLLNEVRLLSLQDMPLLDPLTDHLFFADPPELPLLVREPVVQAQVLVVSPHAAAGLRPGGRVVCPIVVVVVMVVVVEGIPVLSCGCSDNRGYHGGR
ncbi:hypothetical protein EYF80_018913 [Liparis tanakae]|uniref:Uncharacterized protein n=1 Tax=Liparis tanakae TaxID=230148 RepID=A0A4Z2HZ34_9TELE|nr:hypothetical protein EYF80_018913 [Liparis tanakae]